MKIIHNCIKWLIRKNNRFVAGVLFLGSLMSSCDKSPSSAIPDKQVHSREENTADSLPIINQNKIEINLGDWFCDSCSKLGCDFKNSLSEILLHHNPPFPIIYRASFTEKRFSLTVYPMGVNEIYIAGDSLVCLRNGESGKYFYSRDVRWGENWVMFTYNGFVENSMFLNNRIDYKFRSYHHLQVSGSEFTHYIYEDYIHPEVELEFKDWKPLALGLTFSELPDPVSCIVTYNNKYAILIQNIKLPAW